MRMPRIMLIVFLALIFIVACQEDDSPIYANDKPANSKKANTHSVAIDFTSDIKKWAYQYAIVENNIACQLRPGNYVKSGQYTIRIFNQERIYYEFSVDIPEGDIFVISSRLLKKKSTTNTLGEKSLVIWDCLNKEGQIIFPLEVNTETGEKITTTSCFPMGNKINVIAKFIDYKTQKFLFVINDKVGCSVARIKLKKLNSYDFYIPEKYKSMNIDGITYPLEVYVHSVPIEQHHLTFKKQKDKARYLMTVKTDTHWSNLLVFVGYLYRRGRGISNFGNPRIDGPRFIEHLEKFSQKRNYDKVLEIVSKVKRYEKLEDVLLVKKYIKKLPSKNPLCLKILEDLKILEEYLGGK